MNEVEFGLRQLVREQVVDAQPEIRVGELLEQRGVEIGGQHRPCGRDPAAQPSGDGAPARTHLQAAPSRSHAAGLEQPDRSLIEKRLERPQPLTLDCQRVRECIGVRSAVVWALLVALSAQSYSPARTGTSRPRGPLPAPAGLVTVATWPATPRSLP